MDPHIQPEFLPMTREEGNELGIDRFDVILITGDAYLDHPVSAAALLGRTLWDAGFSVGVISQPDIRDPSSCERLGQPNLFFSVSGGSMDSMVAHMTPAKKRRSQDACSPGGIPVRPDRATLVYSDLVHRSFKHSPLIIGGVEASLRRFAHYDYWSDRIRQSLLADAPADLLVYGMGEQQLVSLAIRRREGEEIRAIRDIPGTCWKIGPKERDASDPGGMPDLVQIPSFSEVFAEPEKFAESHAIIAREQNPYLGRPIQQRHPKTIIIQNPPAIPLTTAALDHIYDLPYSRRPHPSYTDPVPALESVRFSITSHRGCYGNCSFCAVAMHQGTVIQSRSPGSILHEVLRLASMPEFRGVITDIGGPSANMYGDTCSRWESEGTCQDRECTTCPARKSGITRYLEILDAAEAVPGVKHAFIGSGIRYDLVPPAIPIMKHICSHVSGHVKVAPEHVAEGVTAIMNKPGLAVFETFRRGFEEIQEGKKKRQYIIPYLMSGHPGCTIPDMITLALYLKENRLYTEQVQDFTPTPMTTSTVMYATGLDPQTMKQVHVPKGEEKRVQRALLHWKDEKLYDLVRTGLLSAGRSDLIGDNSSSLIPRERPFYKGRRTEPEEKGKSRKGGFVRVSRRNRD